MTTELAVRPLAELEATIERGLTTFVEVGQALLAIREGRLYRETHDSFETYCRERWGWGRAHAYRLMDAAEAVAIVSPIGDTAPVNEAQARELARLKDQPEAVREVWSEVTEAKQGHQTAADVREAVDRHLGVPKPTPSAQPHAPVPATVDTVETVETVETGGLCFECRCPIPSDYEACPSCVEPARASQPPRQTIVLQAQTLKPPPEELVYRAITNTAVHWPDHDARAVADIEVDPDALRMQATRVRAAASWLTAVADRLEERSSRPIRAVK